MAWNPLDEPVDYVLLAGQRSPGLAEIVDAVREYHWEQRRGWGFSYARAVFKGLSLVTAKLVLRLYTVQDWADWDSFRELLKPPPPNLRAPTTLAIMAALRPHALAIVHPILAQLDCVSVLITHVKAPMQTGNGEWTAEIGLLEWRRPQFAAVAPEGAQDRPTDPADQSIAALTSIVQNGGEGDVLQALAPIAGGS